MSFEIGRQGKRNSSWRPKGNNNPVFIAAQNVRGHEHAHPKQPPKTEVTAREGKPKDVVWFYRGAGVAVGIAS